MAKDSMDNKEYRDAAPEQEAGASAAPADPLKKKLLIVIAVLVLIAIAVPIINEFIPQTVIVKLNSVEGDKTVKYSTTAHTIFEFMEENADDFGKNDLTRVDTGTFITNNMELEVLRAKPSKATIKGKKRDFYLYDGTVEENLALNDVDFDGNDIIKPAGDTRVKAGTGIEMKEVHYVTKKKVEKIKAKEKGIRFDRTVDSGTIKRTAGKDGKARYVYRHKYVNGKKVKTKRSLGKMLKKPVHVSMVFGTSETGQTGTVKYKDTFIGECTAYYAGEGATGAIGERCHYGTCAVDPSVIPYGTKLYIEDYGFAVANDCGGAVKGHIIDLYMRSTAECFRWGRRNKKVYILE